METAHPELLLWLILIIVVLILPGFFRGGRGRPSDRFTRDRRFYEEQQEWRDWEEHHHGHDEHHDGHHF